MPYVHGKYFLYWLAVDRIPATNLPLSTAVNTCLLGGYGGIDSLGITVSCPVISCFLDVPGLNAEQCFVLCGYRRVAIEIFRVEA